MVKACIIRRSSQAALSKEKMKAAFAKNKRLPTPYEERLYRVRLLSLPPAWKCCILQSFQTTHTLILHTFTKGDQGICALHADVLCHPVWQGEHLWRNGCGAAELCTCCGTGDTSHSLLPKAALDEIFLAVFPSYSPLQPGGHLQCIPGSSAVHRNLCLQALRRNPFAPEVPCHRVVAANLELGGFGGDWVNVAAAFSNCDQILTSCHA